MPIYEVECEVTYSTTVFVEAESVREAKVTAERGPNAWLDGSPHLSYAFANALDASRQGGSGDVYEDPMQAWRDRETA